MQTGIEEKKLKEAMTEALIGVMQNEPKLFRRILVEALEDFGLGEAIKQGRKGSYVDESKIMKALDTK
ncbi:hypothetical protein JXI42_09670 [bacterium]|nr:hypothetical protein [bacterium]